MTVYVNYRHQSDTVTVAELPSTVEAQRWIASQNQQGLLLESMTDHQRTHYYTSQRAAKEWRESEVVR